MCTVAPALAPVRPRAVVAGSTDARLLEEIVAELADELPCGIVPLTGPPGSGKSTALAHLAAVFARDERLQFLDDPREEVVNELQDRALVIVTDPVLGAPRRREVRLAPWRLDDLAEYLLAIHPGRCAAIVQRLGDAARRPWIPQLAVVVLERFAADARAADPVEELCQAVAERVPDPQARESICRFCLSTLVQGSKAFDDQSVQRVILETPDHVHILLRHAMVRLPLAAECVGAALAKGVTADLQSRLPPELVEEVGRRCRVSAEALQTLHVASPHEGFIQAMAASILHVADSQWRPGVPQTAVWDFRGGYFDHAQWAAIDLTGAILREADFSDAQLQRAKFANVLAGRARFDGAELTGADLTKIQAPDASFLGASLASAKLVGADFRRADFTEADLRGAHCGSANFAEANLTSASLRGADLSYTTFTRATLENADLCEAVLRHAKLGWVDLRTARLDGANLTHAGLHDANLEGVHLLEAQLAGAKLQNAHLTGSVMPRANLSEADLTGAGLAEIQWEDADLRGANLAGATFHMGSSRSGLVGSPIACEGSKTGFYTDDYEEMHFKRPEDVRKANLCRADLRGAYITGLDFYLVDLRGAKLDAAQLAHVRKCGAILEDVVA